MTKVYLIRHAEAEGNIYRRMDGHYNSRITLNGQRQVEALAKRFADVPIDAVYASDLLRTCQTARALCVPKGLPLRPDSRFREVYFGVIEDLNFGWIDRFAAEQNRLFSKAPEQWHVEGAETFSEATCRFLDGLRAVAQAHEGQTIAVFSHGAITAWSMRALFGAQIPGAARCDNTGVTLLTWENGAFTPEYFYDNSHLSEEISTLAHQLWWRGTNSFNLWFRDAGPEDAAMFDPAFPMKAGDVQKVAMRMDEPVGCLSYAPESGAVSCLYLLPEHRGKRMGDQLLGEIVCPCRAAGREFLTLSFDPENLALKALLARHGATVDGGSAVVPIALPKE